MALEISAERMAYPARHECLLLSEPEARDGRASFGHPRIGGRLEEGVWPEGKFEIRELSALGLTPNSTRNSASLFGVDLKGRLSPSFSFPTQCIVLCKCPSEPTIHVVVNRPINIRYC